MSLPDSHPDSEMFSPQDNVDQHSFGSKPRATQGVAGSREPSRYADLQLASVPEGSATYTQRPPAGVDAASSAREIDDAKSSGSDGSRAISCSAFAARETRDIEVLEWMFDRKAVPLSLAMTEEFSEEYYAMTDFIWPDGWKNESHLLECCCSMAPLMNILIKEVDGYRERAADLSMQDRCFVNEAEFEEELKILTGSFCSIFQACVQAGAKAVSTMQSNETEWRGDHDRLFFDLFLHPVYPNLERNDSTRVLLEATLRFPRNDVLGSEKRGEILQGVQRLYAAQSSLQLDHWKDAHGGTIDEVNNEVQKNFRTGMLGIDWFGRRSMTNSVEAGAKLLRNGPSSGRCDSLGQLIVRLERASPSRVEKSSLVVRPTHKIEDKSTVSPPQHEGGNKAKSNGVLPAKMKNELGNAISNGHPRVDLELKNVRSQDPVDEVNAQTQRTSISDETGDKESTALGLPILVGEHKRPIDGTGRETNQLRMCLTAAVKYLEAIGIAGVPVYGMQMEGPTAVFSAAVVKGKSRSVHLFERLATKVDISTPIGAWHYATILCRLAVRRAKRLEREFDKVKVKFIQEAMTGNIPAWTASERIAGLPKEIQTQEPAEMSK